MGAPQADQAELVVFGRILQLARSRLKGGPAVFGTLIENFQGPVLFQRFQHRLEILPVKLRRVVVPVQIAVKIMEILWIIEGFCVPKGFRHFLQLAVREKQPDPADRPEGI